MRGRRGLLRRARRPSRRARTSRRRRRFRARAWRWRSRCASSSIAAHRLLGVGLLRVARDRDLAETAPVACSPAPRARSGGSGRGRGVADDDGGVMALLGAAEQRAAGLCEPSMPVSVRWPSRRLSAWPAPARDARLAAWPISAVSAWLGSRRHAGSARHHQPRRAREAERGGAVDPAFADEALDDARLRVLVEADFAPRDGWRRQSRHGRSGPGLRSRSRDRASATSRRPASRPSACRAHAHRRADLHRAGFERLAS